MVEFAKNVKNEFDMRSSEVMNIEDLEFLVEGTINYLHTHAYIQDPNAEIYIDSTEVNFIKATSNQQDARLVYQETRKLLRKTFEKSNLPNKWVVWADLEFVPMSNGDVKILWVMKVGEDNGSRLMERSEGIPPCTFSSSALLDADQAVTAIASCALDNVGPYPINSNQSWSNISYGVFYSRSWGGWEFICDGGPGCYGTNVTPCSVYYANGANTQAGNDLYYLDGTELNDERDNVESASLALLPTSFDVMDIDGKMYEGECLFDIDLTHEYTVFKGYLSYTPGDGGGGGDEEL